MTDRSVYDHLKSEGLYEPVLRVMLSLDPADMTYSSREEARALLDRIFIMGKIVGRRTAIGRGNAVGDPDTDALIEGWQRAVDSK